MSVARGKAAFLHPKHFTEPEFRSSSVHQKLGKKTPPTPGNRESRCSQYIAAATWWCTSASSLCYVGSEAAAWRELKLGGIRSVSLLDANMIALGVEKGPELL